MEDIIKGFIFGVIVTIMVGGLITLIINPSSEGHAICKQYSCNMITKEAAYEVLGKTEFSGGGNILGTNPKVLIKIKNNENQGAKFKVFISCETLKKPTTEMASEAWIQPRGIYEFEFSYEIGASEDWKCSFSRVESDMIQNCELKEV